MADSYYDVTEIRFKISPDYTEAYVFVQTLDHGCPLSFQGWHYKVFPKETNTMDIMTDMHSEGDGQVFVRIATEALDTLLEAPLPHCSPTTTRRSIASLESASFDHNPRRSLTSLARFNLAAMIGRQYQNSSQPASAVDPAGVGLLVSVK